MITVEYYDSKEHGLKDDCDYVVEYQKLDEQLLAKEIAEKLSPCDYEEYGQRLYCCHA